MATGKRKPLGLWNLFSVSPDVPTAIHRSAPNVWCLDFVSLLVEGMRIRWPQASEPSALTPSDEVLVIEAACGKDALLFDCFPPRLGAVTRACDGARHTHCQGPVTVPKVVRDALGLRQGDQLSWELEDGSVRVRVVAPLDVAYLQGLEGTLSEWSSAADDQAFAGL